MYVLDKPNLLMHLWPCHYFQELKSANTKQIEEQRVIGLHISTSIELCNCGSQFSSGNEIVKISIETTDVMQCFVTDCNDQSKKETC